MKQALELYAVVRVCQLTSDNMDRNGWRLNSTDPKVGDVGAIVEIWPSTNGSDLYIVENCDSNGETVWLSDFTEDEIEAVVI
jgi:hypothetical protein